MIQSEPKGSEGPFSTHTIKGKLANFILAKPALALAIIMSFLGVFGLVTWFAIQGSFADDFSVYWRTANESITLAYAPRDELPFPYAPTMLLWISPLSGFPMWPAFALWVLLSSYTLATACRQHLSTQETWLVMVNPIVINGLSTGQVSAFLAGVLLWSMSTKNRILAGLALAFIASVKPQLVLLAPLLLFARRDWLILASAAVGFAAILCISLLVFGLAPWFEWVASMENFHRVLVIQNVLAVVATPAGAAERWGLPPLPFLVAGTLAGIWIVLKCKNLGPLERSAAIATGSLCAAPYALTYDLAAVVPFLAWIIFRGSFAGAIAIGGPLHPIPLILTSYGLLRRGRHSGAGETLSPVGAPQQSA